MRPWPVREEHHKHMKQRQQQNRAKCMNSKAENWMAGKLLETGMKWTRQAQWGFRLFDFWNVTRGIAVEVDGREHRAAEDEKQDAVDFEKSGIVVIRVQNFDEEQAQNAIVQITSSGSWNERRARLGLKSVSGGSLSC